jgi:hypothetical protein
MTDELQALKNRIRTAVQHALTEGHAITDANPGAFGLAWRGATNTVAAYVMLAMADETAAETAADETLSAGAE